MSRFILFANYAKAMTRRSQQRLLYEQMAQTALKDFIPAPTPTTAQCPIKSMALVSSTLAQSVTSTQKAFWIKAAKNLAKKDSLKQEKIEFAEKLGEQGMIHKLKEELAGVGLPPYDDKCMHVFSGKNTFNGVYVYPSLEAPEFVVVLEGKGGGSQCGTRKVMKEGKVTEVKQGTSEYFDEEVEVMKAEGGHKEKVATAIQQCQGGTPSKVVYMGVRTAYKDMEIYRPEYIFVVRS
ncbi:hypothetical protein [Hyalangium versicolor]|uniref:hypothetical protein n=1 Tax=Hyalangium versicolor TaxID=2861190 RepID=UPI001CCFC91A|nr:hypothetical protein [Hyalangium versicolor]